MSVSASGGEGGRRLDRLLGVDWAEPPATLLDVDVVVVYADGERERVADERLTLREEGVLVEGHPLRDERVLRVEVEYAETETPLARLVAFLRGLPAAVRRLPEDFRRWRGE